MNADSHDVRRPDPKVWADPPAYAVVRPIAGSRKRGWRDAPEQLREQAPFFVRRMRGEVTALDNQRGFSLTS